MSYLERNIDYTTIDLVFNELVSILYTLLYYNSILYLLYYLQYYSIIMCIISKPTHWIQNIIYVYF